MLVQNGIGDAPFYGHASGYLIWRSDNQPHCFSDCLAAIAFTAAIVWVRFKIDNQGVFPNACQSAFLNGGAMSQSSALSLSLTLSAAPGTCPRLHW